MAESVEGPSGDGVSSGSERDVRGGERDLAATLRDEVGDRRDAAGAARDLESESRDETSNLRDVAAEARDRAAESRDRAAAAGTGQRHADLVFAADDRTHAAEDRLAGARDRSTSEHDRTTSLADREAGEAERSGSERDRVDGNADRLAAADERAAAAIDDLTGARTRGSGMAELVREMARAERTSRPLTLAYVDVDHLKTINDSRGHAAGDAALVAVVDAIKAVLRSYDLVVRLGGDEFLCVLGGLTEDAARDRLVGATSSLAAAGEPSATFGFAEHRAGDVAGELIARADADLLARRQERGVQLVERPASGS